MDYVVDQTDSFGVNAQRERVLVVVEPVVRRLAVVAVAFVATFAVLFFVATE